MIKNFCKWGTDGGARRWKIAKDYLKNKHPKGISSFLLCVSWTKKSSESSGKLSSVLISLQSRVPLSIINISNSLLIPMSYLRGMIAVTFYVRFFSVIGKVFFFFVSFLFGQKWMFFFFGSSWEIDKKFQFVNRPWTWNYFYLKFWKVCL